VRLDRNQRQSRIEEKMLGRNVACPEGNAQLRGGQIMWRTVEGYRGEGEGNTSNREGAQMGPRRDPNAMDVNRGRGGDRMCYVCGKWGHMAKNCWERHKGRVVEMLHKLAKENGGQ